MLKKQQSKEETDFITAKNIIALREKLKMSSEQFAEFLNVTTNTVARWEAGIVKPTSTSLSVISPLIASLVLGLGTGDGLLGNTLKAFSLPLSNVASRGISGGYQIYRALKNIFETNSEK